MLRRENKKNGTTIIASSSGADMRNCLWSVCAHCSCNQKKSYRALHINCGLIYYFMTSFGFAIGIIMQAKTGKDYMTPWLGTHQIIGTIVILLFGTGA